jgi:hypothetical protein
MTRFKGFKRFNGFKTFLVQEVRGTLIERSSNSMMCIVLTGSPAARNPESI